MTSNAIPTNSILETLVNRIEMRDHLAPFVKQVVATVDPGAVYKHNWHIDLICEYLEACTNGDIKRLIINIPPRHLKTLIVSVAWPAWLLGKNPSEQILSTTYSQSLSMRDSVNCRLVVQSEWYKKLFPEVEIVSDMNMKSEFVTTERGHRIATSVGGTSIGRGGKVLLCDDPLNPLQALSDIERIKTNTWLDQNFMTRFNDEKEGVAVLVMQRLHTDDPTGHFKEKGGWEHLVVPLEAEKKEIWDFGRVKHVREEGEILHEERMGASEIAQKKKDLGSYGYAGQYQQRPSPLKGGMIDLQWFKRYTTIPKEFIRIIQSWDTASKDKEINDLIDVYRDRIQYPQLERAAKGKFRQFNPSTILIEDKSSGISLIQTLRQSTDGKYPVIAIEPEKDKVTRMSTCTPTIEAGYCYLPVQASWLPDYESELMNFPNSTTKDNVDATSQFLNYVREPKEVTLRSL
jgi:predicted phage terminase large subunit-like protein